MKKTKKPKTEKKLRLVKEIVKGQLGEITGGMASPCYAHPTKPPGDF